MKRKRTRTVSTPIPLAIPDLTGREMEYVTDCVRSNFVSSVGPYVTRFEDAVAASCGAPGAVAVASGTAGLHLALECVGVGRDDLVILPSFTFIASANAIAHCGAMPWLFDIDKESWTLSPVLVERELEAQTEKRGGALMHKATGRRVAALMPVYTLGTPGNMDALADIGRRFGLPVVADAAAAIGAGYKGRPLAEIADVTVFSFNGNKTVTSGGGGAIVAVNKELLAKARHRSTQARVGSEYVHDAVGYNYRMTNLEAALGVAQMERLDRLVASKRRIRKRYDDAFRGIPGIGAFPQPGWAQSACWLSGITLHSDHHSADALRTALNKQEIAAGEFWRPAHLQPPYADCPRTDQGVGDSIWPNIVMLPSSTALTALDQDRVIAAVRKYMAEAG